MFRLVEDLGIINRYGFNSRGTEEVKRNLLHYYDVDVSGESEITAAGDDKGAVMDTVRRTLHWAWYKLYPPVSTKDGLVGINIGKNKTSDDAAADYVYNIKEFAKHADFMVINVSSPNTAGLRDLQQSDSLRVLLTKCIEARNQQAIAAQTAPVPLLVKLAPDLTDDELQSIATTCLDVGIDGVVLTNTTNQRPDDLVSANRVQVGGLSGAPVKDMSTECIRKMYRYTDGKLPIVGVGGVGTGRDAFEKFKAGASLVEVYSMMVFNGPGSVSRIRHELADLMIQNGKRSIEDVVGMDHEDIFWRRREEQKLQRIQREGSRDLLLQPLQRQKQQESQPQPQ